MLWRQNPLSTARRLSAAAPCWHLQRNRKDFSVLLLSKDTEVSLFSDLVTRISSMDIPKMARCERRASPIAAASLSISSTLPGQANAVISSFWILGARMALNIMGILVDRPMYRNIVNDGSMIEC